MKASQKEFVKYRRVSAESQGESGLGLQDQDIQLDRFVDTNGGIVVATFVDVATGKNESRPGLRNALRECKARGATLLIWTLARISRRRLFIEELLESDVDFIVVSQPHATNLVLRLHADFDTHEVEQISTRTKAGLAVLKERVKRGESWISKSGKVCNRLGNTENFSDEGRHRGAMAVQSAALNNEENRRAAMYALLLRESGDKLPAICKKLAEGGFKTATGGEFHPASIQRIIRRQEEFQKEIERLVEMQAAREMNKLEEEPS
jgi:hypothetical protein